MRALVTGGGGFLGLYVVEQLLAQGDSVRVFSRGRYPSLETMDVDCQQGDLRDKDSVDRAIKDIDCVFHCAAVPGVWGSWDMYHGINTLGTQNVIAACQKHGVQKLVYTSSPSVVFDGKDHVNADESLPYPQSFLCHYPHSKMLAEKSVRAANSQTLATVTLRPHLIWGPRDNHLIPRLISRARSGRLRIVGDGTNMISMSYVENAAAAHVQAVKTLQPDAAHAGRAYFINEAEPVNLWNWINELLGIAGLPPVTKSISEKSATRLGSVLETVWKIFRLGGEPPMTRFVAAQLAGTHSYDISAAQRDFGYTPLVSPAEGMQRITPMLQQLNAGTYSKGLLQHRQQW